ncbi:DeoR/GlpR transcriptional regulator [Phytoactinopolyspora halotolerans]|uniref:DeoR/GlpR transcriptional regulator n=2 Tax=Phytoactinopolyspora halotolerans TaxID=1981512 RepID=A0A6L9S5X6_9ACTN|nr:DeoR/GlpR transcriptional regulator [Phytoactinopolyspora halotolerans]
MLQLLAERGSLSVDEAVEELDVSHATVRRDFDHLAKQQLLARTRGGAVTANVSYDLPLRYKASQHASEKERIAQKVVEQLRPGSVVGLNGGTTLTQVARAIALDERFHLDGPAEGVTVVTNALNIASELVVRPHIKVVVVGGVARHRSYELVGSLASRVLDVISIDTAVIGVNAIDPDRGAMVFDEGEAGINAQLAERAERVIVPADSSKINQRAFTTVLPVTDIDLLVTDSGADAAAVTQFINAGVEVIQA